MYDQDKTPWWLEAFVLTKAIFGILFRPLVVIIAAIVAIGGLFVAFGAGLVWGLLALAIIVACVAIFAWWDRSRPPRL